MKVLIVDDEAPARARLRRLLEKNKYVQIVGEATNGLEALEAIQKLAPDVVFLDIEMPELDGFGVAEALKKTSLALVFVTAYSEHALKAFDVSAVDYLVKPVAEERLQLTLQKLKVKPGSVLKKSGDFDYSNLAHAIVKKNTRRFAVRCGAKFVVFDPSTISAVIAKDHYAAIITNGRELLADDPLDILLARLNPESFVRVHRSAVINVEYLKELEREGDRKYVAVLNDPRKTRVPISRDRLAELKTILGIE